MYVAVWYTRYNPLVPVQRSTYDAPLWYHRTKKEDIVRGHTGYRDDMKAKKRFDSESHHDKQCWRSVANSVPISTRSWSPSEFRFLTHGWDFEGGNPRIDSYNSLCSIPWNDAFIIPDWRTKELLENFRSRFTRIVKKSRSMIDRQIDIDLRHCMRGVRTPLEDKYLQATSTSRQQHMENMRTQPYYNTTHTPYLWCGSSYSPPRKTAVSYIQHSSQHDLGVSCRACRRVCVLSSL